MTTTLWLSNTEGESCCRHFRTCAEGASVFSFVVGHWPAERGIMEYWYIVGRLGRIIFKTVMVVGVFILVGLAIVVRSAARTGIGD